MTELLNELHSYVTLQSRLISQLKQEVDNEGDWDDPFRMIGRDKETITLEGEKWTLRRHGVGCCFTRIRDGQEIDALKFLGSAPSSFEAWSIEFYFESKGIKRFNFNRSEFEVDFREIDNCFLKMKDDGLLKCVDGGRVYELTSLGLAGG